MTISFKTVSLQQIHKVKQGVLNSMYVDIHQVAPGGYYIELKCGLNHDGFAGSSRYWWVLVAFELQRPRLRPFFEKLEKKQEKLEKKQNCQQGESNPGFLCGRQVS